MLSGNELFWKSSPFRLLHLHGVRSQVTNSAPVQFPWCFSSVPELSSREQLLNYSFSRANSETGEVLNALPVYSTWQMLILVTQVAPQGAEGCAHSDEVTGRVLQGSKIGKRSLSLPSVLLGLTALVGSDGRHDLGSQRKTEDPCILNPG